MLLNVFIYFLIITEKQHLNEKNFLFSFMWTFFESI
jgi:hypothetical protein